MAAATLALVGLGVSVLGTGLSAFGQYQSGKAEREAYEYNAAVTEKKAAYEEDVQRRKLRMLMGHQRALYGKAGVDISEGSPLLVLADTAAEGEKEALAIRYGAKSESALQRMYGRSAYYRGLYGAGSTALTGLGGAATSYATWKK